MQGKFNSSSSGQQVQSKQQFPQSQLYEVQVEDMWDETERVRPPLPDGNTQGSTEDNEAAAQLNFNLSDPDQIRQDFYQSFGFMTSNMPEMF